MKKESVNFLLWIAILPSTIIAFVLTDIILRLILAFLTMWTLGSDLENAFTNSGLFADFFAGAIFIIAGTEIAPNYKFIISVILLFIYVSLTTYILLFQAIIPLNYYSSFTIVSGNIGAVLGFLYMKKEMKNENR